LAAKTYDAFSDSAGARATTVENLRSGRRAADLVSLDSFEHVTYPFVGYDSSLNANNIDSGDTFDLGLSGDQVVHRLAWEPTSATQVALSESSGTVTFLTSASNATGYLHVWISG